MAYGHGAFVVRRSMKNKKLTVWLAVLAVAMALATPAQAYESREAIVSQGHGACSPTYLAVHETGNAGASAANHVTYWRRTASWVCMTHYVMELDGSAVYHTQPDNTVAWHVGNGNSRCVGIELTHATDRRTFERQWDEAVAWCADYLHGRGWGIGQLVSHQDCSRRWGGSDHTDPDGYFAVYGRSWEQFKTAVAGRMNAQATGGHDSGFAGGSYRCTVPALNLRTAPSLSGRVTGTLREGETVLLDSWYTTADGWIWGRLHRGGTTLYAAVGKPTGKPEANDYLVLAGDGVASYDVDALARAVIRGEYGTGAARRNALGARYEAVQRRVNQMLG